MNILICFDFCYSYVSAVLFLPLSAFTSQISSSKLASLLATASHLGTGIPDPPASRSDPQVFLGDVPITSSTFGHAQPTKAKETTSNLRSHSLAEGDTSALGLDSKFLKASTPPPLPSSLSGDNLRDFPGQGGSFLGNDSQEDSSRELERLLEVENHPVAGYQSKYLAGKDAGNSDDILGRKPTPSTQDSMHRCGVQTCRVLYVVACAFAGPASLLSVALLPVPGKPLPPPT